MSLCWRRGGEGRAGAGSRGHCRGGVGFPMAGARRQGARVCEGSSRSPRPSLRLSVLFLSLPLLLPAASSALPSSSGRGGSSGESPLVPPAAPGRPRLHFHGPAGRGEASAEKPPVLAERSRKRSERHPQPSAPGRPGPLRCAPGASAVRGLFGR